MKNVNPYALSVKMLTVVIALCSVSLAALMLMSDAEVDFNINWNMFKSPLTWPLLILGFILGLGQKFNVYEPWTVTKYSDHRPDKYEPNHDVIENMNAGCLMPILEVLVIRPVGFAAMIYYGLMILISVFGIFFPFLVAAFMVYCIFFFYKIERKLVGNRHRNVLIPGIAVIFIFAFWLIYHVWTKADLWDNGATSSLAGIIALSSAVLSIGLYILLVATSKCKDHAYNPGAPLKRKSIIFFGICSSIIIAVLCYMTFAGDSYDRSYAGYTHETETYTVNTETTLNVRSGPGTTYDIIGALSQGEKINVLNISDGWAKIKYNGNTAYVSADYITNSKAAVSADKTPVDIPATSGVIDSWQYNSFASAKKLSEEDRKRLHINRIIPSAKANELIKGKIIYDNDKKGRLESFLFDNDDIREYLVSTTTEGEYIAHIMIGEIMAYANYRTYSTIKSNKIIRHIYVGPEPGYDEEEISEELYTILPNLTFIKD